MIPLTLKRLSSFQSQAIRLVLIPYRFIIRHQDSTLSFSIKSKQQIPLFCRKKLNDIIFSRVKSNRLLRFGHLRLAFPSMPINDFERGR